jgi:ATP-dependent Clp protease ATP-binding subunit ClpX
LATVTPDDLVRYGLIPEFVGRFPSIIGLEHLTKQQLVTIYFLRVEQMKECE